MPKDASRLPNLSSLQGNAPATIKPRQDDVLTTLDVYFGPMATLSKEERDALDAWNDAIEKKMPQNQIDQLRKKFEDLMKRDGR